MLFTASYHGDSKPASAGTASSLCRLVSVLAPQAVGLLLLFGMALAPRLLAQTPALNEVKPIPLLTGSAGFIATFESDEPQLGPIVTPVVLIPLGQRWLIETRGDFESDLTQVPGQSGFHGQVQKGVDYAQLDFIANPYMTVTVGRFLTPFNIYNERLYPVWIRDLQTDPLILPIGIGPSNASNGAMLRGGFKVHPTFDINYAVYFSTLTTTEYIDSARFAGGRVGIFMPKTRLEFGGSFQHSLQDERSNSFGFHAIWEPFALPLEMRAEYGRCFQGSGYWGEVAYRLSQVSYFQKQLRHTQLVARLQQSFAGEYSDTSLFPVDLKMFEFGVNYYVLDGLKATSSYGRQFRSDGNTNVWTLGLTYRFVFPLGNAWR